MLVMLVGCAVVWVNQEMVLENEAVRLALLVLTMM